METLDASIARALKHDIKIRTTVFPHSSPPTVRFSILLCAVLFLIALPVVCKAADKSKSPEDLRREAAIAEFTRKTKEANYPALFEKAAAEFNVPADILKGIAFAETRWEHLTWPPGETRSPENGMPRPYGIMSLQDNEFFGHSLIDAAKLIGKDPEELKRDPYQNIRGAAALLKKIYDENPKPDGTKEGDIESWRNAIVKYCGIPEPDLGNQHALDVYIFMTSGYHQYGIEWNARPVNIEPMRAEVAKIVAEERRKSLERQNQLASQSTNEAKRSIAGTNLAETKSGDSTNDFSISTAVAMVEPGRKMLPWLVGVAIIILLLVAFMIYLQSRNKNNLPR